jgi:hypothetical protein
MADKVDLSDFMTMSFGDIPEQKLLEDGIYEFVVQGYFDRQYEKDGETRTIVTVRTKADSVIESEYDDDDLGVSEVVRMDFFCTEPALAQKSPVISLRAFCRDILDLSSDEVANLDVAPALEMLTGRRFSGVVKRGMGGKNKDIPEAKITKVIEVV